MSVHLYCMIYIVKVQSYSETPLYSRQDWDEHFVFYSEVSLTQKLLVHFQYIGMVLSLVPRPRYEASMVLCHWTVEHMQHGYVFRAFLCCALTGKANQRLILAVTAVLMSSS